MKILLSYKNAYMVFLKHINTDSKKMKNFLKNFFILKNFLFFLFLFVFAPYVLLFWILLMVYKYSLKYFFLMFDMFMYQMEKFYKEFFIIRFYGYMKYYMLIIFYAPFFVYFVKWSKKYTLKYIFVKVLKLIEKGILKLVDFFFDALPRKINLLGIRVWFFFRRSGFMFKYYFFKFFETIYHVIWYKMLCRFWFLMFPKKGNIKGKKKSKKIKLFNFREKGFLYQLCYMMFGSLMNLMLFPMYFFLYLIRMIFYCLWYCVYCTCYCVWYDIRFMWFGMKWMFYVIKRDLMMLIYLLRVLMDKLLNLSLILLNLSFMMSIIPYYIRYYLMKFLWWMKFSIKFYVEFLKLQIYSFYLRYYVYSVHCVCLYFILKLLVVYKFVWKLKYWFLYLMWFIVNVSLFRFFYFSWLVIVRFWSLMVFNFNFNFQMFYLNCCEYLLEIWYLYKWFEMRFCWFFLSSYLYILKGKIFCGSVFSLICYFLEYFIYLVELVVSVPFYWILCWLLSYMKMKIKSLFGFMYSGMKDLIMYLYMIDKYMWILNFMFFILSIIEGFNMKVYKIFLFMFCIMKFMFCIMSFMFYVISRPVYILFYILFYMAKGPFKLIFYMAKGPFKLIFYMAKGPFKLIFYIMKILFNFMMYLIYILIYMMNKLNMFIFQVYNKIVYGELIIVELCKITVFWTIYVHLFGFIMILILIFFNVMTWWDVAWFYMNNFSGL